MHHPVGYEATPLSHAVCSSDFAFVEWLLENGADPEADCREWNRDEFVYHLDGNEQRVINERFQDLIRKSKQKEESKGTS